jgi:inhibitor of KinA
MALYRSYPVGDSCIGWSLGAAIDPGTSRFVLSAYRKLKPVLAGYPGFRDLVPTYTALSLHFNPLAAPVDAMVQTVESVLATIDQPAADSDPVPESRIQRIPVRYGGYYLERLALLKNLSPARVVELHTRPVYTVAMIGFIPHFPYLLGLDSRLEAPRLESPRTRVPAGAVAIGGAQTGIYPSESPGGWNIIGLTDPALTLTLAPGDTLCFYEEEKP